MEIQRAEELGCIVLRLDGRLDATNAMDLEKEARALLSLQPHPLILSLGGLEYISSAGLRVLLLSAKLAQAKGTSVALCALSDAVRKVMELSGFIPVFRIFADETAAIQALKP